MKRNSPAALPVDQAEEVFDFLRKVGGVHPRARNAFVRDTARLARATVFVSSGTTIEVYFMKGGWYAELASPDDFCVTTRALLSRVNDGLDMAYRKFN